MLRRVLVMVAAVVCVTSACTDTAGGEASTESDPTVIHPAGVDPGLIPPQPDPGGLVVMAEPLADRGELVVTALDGTVRNRTPLTQPVRHLLAAGDGSDLVLVVLERGVLTYAARTATLRPTALPPGGWKVVDQAPGRSIITSDGRIAVVDTDAGTVVAAPATPFEDPLQVLAPPNGPVVLLADAAGRSARIDTRTGRVDELGVGARLGSADAAGRRLVHTVERGGIRTVVVDHVPGPFESATVGPGDHAVMAPSGDGVVVFDRTVRSIDLPARRATIHGPLGGPVFDAFVAPSGDAVLYLERGEHSIGRFLDLTGSGIRSVPALASVLPMPGQRAGSRIVWFAGLLGDGPLVAVDTETGDHTVFEDDQVGFIGFPPGAVSPTGTHAAFSVLEGGQGGVTVYDMAGGTRELLTGPGLTRPAFGPDGAGLLTLRMSGPEDAYPTARLTDLDGNVIRDLGEVAGAAWVALG